MHPESTKNPALDKLSTFFFYIFLFAFIVALAFPHNPAGNWYQQFMPSTGGRTITDMTFTDSLYGYAITNEVSDTSFILKTSNGGDNWFLSHFDTGVCSYYNVQFINQNTGFVSGYIYNGVSFRILKTTNGGTNWFYVNFPNDIVAIDMFVLNQDTIWLVDSGSLTGGVFRTTNGGVNWTQQLNLGSQNPSEIYMYNARIGFASSTAGLYKTTNGSSWFNASSDFSFSDMFFTDSLTGWKAGGSIKKTTNGGINWVNQPIPQGGNILGNGAMRFMNRDNDTIWAIGESIIVSGSPPTRGILFRTINGGNTWQFQVPDTAIHINRYFFGQFINNRIGWGYSFNPTGIHTTNGGDTGFITSVSQISYQVAVQFKLYQNYPNPFNPVTNIKYQIIKNNSQVKISVFDITGKHVTELVNAWHSAGIYLIDWNASGFASGVYFYKLIVSNGRDEYIQTKKMLLVK